MYKNIIIPACFILLLANILISCKPSPDPTATLVYNLHHNSVVVKACTGNKKIIKVDNKYYLQTGEDEYTFGVYNVIDPSIDWKTVCE